MDHFAGLIGLHFFMSLVKRLTIASAQLNWYDIKD
jgi:hypothetical protein